MNGEKFINIIRAAFCPFLAELGFFMNRSAISGRMYHAEFTGKRNVISISYEFGDDALFVIIFSTEKGELSHYDDLVSTPRLSNLNSRYMRLVSPRERIETDIAFSAITGEGKAEKLLIKSAKELRLVLPKYMAEHDASKRAT